MGQLIDDILAYSRLERTDMQASEVYPGKLVESLLAERDDDIKTRGVAVDVNLPSVAVTADRDGLTMALRNLLENALKRSAGAMPAQRASCRCAITVPALT
jgi:signal transduction histidine kinase